LRDFRQADGSIIVDVDTGVARLVEGGDAKLLVGILLDDTLEVSGGLCKSA